MRVLLMAGPFVAQVQRQLAGGACADVVVEGPGAAAEEATAFLRWLAAHGRGSYTQRAYALGLAHFLSWLDRRGIELAAVDRRVVAEYIVAFRSGVEDGLELGRQPRT